MLEFHEITLADKNWMRECFKRANYASEEYNFSFCYIWRDILHYRAARFEDFLLIKSARGERPVYLFPAGSGDAKPALEALRADAEAAGADFVMMAVLPEHRALLETLYPDRFEFTELNDYWDYVYDAQSLITLKGKKLHSKRNHINRFKLEYPDWVYEPITPENMPEVLRMSDEWCRINECDASRTLRDEACSVREMLGAFFDLDVDGGLIRAGGRVVAFSVGDRLNADTYLVHIEKAFSDVNGAYTIINQQFAEHNCGGYLYVNREDDSGQEGLRKAKLSYRPVSMAEKSAARWK